MSSASNPDLKTCLKSSLVAGPAPVWIALGSNLGDRPGQLVAGLQEIRRFVTIEKLSHLYETEPMYVTDQPAFLNAVIMGRTSLGPMSLLKELKAAEARVGRLERQRFGPRELDLDLLAYGSLELKVRALGQYPLDLPHPKIGERRFVVLPLSEVSSQVPGLLPTAMMLTATADQVNSIRPYEDPRWPRMS
jgi:2-amino-4-hydroxy-6-hydroxymethyldihydropteridine diphosphokinase